MTKTSHVIFGRPEKKFSPTKNKNNRNKINISPSRLRLSVNIFGGVVQF
jgi:hypothetical protein